MHYLTSARAVCERVQGAADAVGVLCCGTGMGMSIAANKFRGIYAARCVSAEDAEMARIINNANVLCLAASAGLAVNAQIIDAFMRTPFEGRKIEQLEHLCDFELEARPAPLSDVRVPAVDDVLPKTA
ncbi:MAG: RpiB/LacA/LacB family sugar-phosphate isomerase [Deltaproteobacteria bacterium]|nr:MAG: RpiB/LacA/LacB family sugar-phosphate isomerase [Deltaproteobacteria bacterium]